MSGRNEGIALGALILLILGFGPGAAGCNAARAATPFDGVVTTPHHLAFSPAESCLLCHTDGPGLPTSGEPDRPQWAQKSRIMPFTLDTQPMLDVEPDYHPFGPSTACLSCHDGALAVNVHGVSPEVERRGGNTDGRMMDHPDSILYPRRPDGAFQTERSPPHISRYWSIPDRAAVYSHGQQAPDRMEMPQGQVSTYLLKASGLASVGPETAPLLVRTSAGRIYCDSCHNPHTNRFAPFLRGTPKTLCLVCHDR